MLSPFYQPGLVPVTLCQGANGLKVLYFYLQGSPSPFQPKAGLPRGGGVKKNTLAVKQQVGFEPGTFGPQSNALTTWLQCYFLESHFLNSLTGNMYFEVDAELAGSAYTSIHRFCEVHNVIIYMLK